MGKQPSLPQQEYMGVLIRPCLWVNLAQRLANMDGWWGGVALRCTFRSSIYYSDADGPACHEVCGCSQLLSGRVARFATRHLYFGNLGNEEWGLRYGRYRLLHI